MSECIGKTTEEQKKCKYYEKSSYKNHCMYSRFGIYCDCLDAQIDASKSPEEKNQEVIEEMRDSEIGRTD